MKTLTQRVVPFQVKADKVDPNARTFEGLAAIWTLDQGNDVIKKGAFANTIKEWKKSGEALPLLNSHDHWDIFSAIGQMLDAAETKDGLWTKWEVLDGPEGDAVLARLRPSARTGRAIIGKMSIGFEPLKFSFEQPEGTPAWDRIRHLEEIALKEVSLVLFPMAQGASIDASSVKMFLANAKATDPTTVDALTRAELRRLASRIGILVKVKTKAADPAPAPDSAVDDEVDDTDDTDLHTPAIVPDTAPTPDVVEDEEEQVEEDEGHEVIVSDAVEGTVVETSGDTPTTTLPEKSAVPKPVIYQYPEALQHRLQKVLLKNKVTAITSNHSTT